MSDKSFVEKAVLGAALKDYSIFKQNLDFYKEDNFDDIVNKQIVNILFKYNDIRLIDIDLQSKKEYQTAEGLEYLKYLKNIEIAPNDVTNYLDKLIELKTANELSKNYAQALININERKAFEELVEDHKKISTLNISIRDEELTQEEEALDIIETSLRNAQEGVEISGIRTGYDKLDTYLNGLQRGELLLFAGRPGSAKSSICLNILDNISIRKTDYRTIFFSLEMKRRVVLSRLYVSYAKAVFNEVTNGTKLTPEQWKRFRYGYEKIIKGNFKTYDRSMMSPNEMRAKLALEKNKETPADVVIVDYLQIMGADKKFNNLHEQVGYNAQALKDISKEFNVAMIAVSQLSRAVENRENKRPILSDLRECVVGNSKLYTSEFEFKDISKIKVGEKIASLNKNDGKFIFSKVLDIWSNGLKPVYKVRTFSGKEITCTSNHPFLTIGGWKPLSDLKPNDSVTVIKDMSYHPEPIVSKNTLDLCRFIGYMCGNGSVQKREISHKKIKELLTIKDNEFLRTLINSDIFYEKIESIELLEEKQEVFDIKIENTHNFLCNGIVVHNSGGIEQAGDTIMGIYREDYYTGNDVGLAELEGLKGRNIGTGKLFLGFIKEYMRFENLWY